MIHPTPFGPTPLLCDFVVIVGEAFVIDNICWSVSHDPISGIDKVDIENSKFPQTISHLCLDKVLQPIQNKREGEVMGTASPSSGGILTCVYM